MNQLVVPVGYMGSGSSAITDLVSEFEGYQAENGTFEYVFLHCPNGVFDLEDKLLSSNNALRSDEALHSFSNTMKQLYDKKWWWVGGYQWRISKEFWSITVKYLEELIEYKPEFYWYMQENTNLRMFVQLVWKRFVSLVTLHKVQLKKPLLYFPVWISFIKPERFYQATHQYIYRIFHEMGFKEHNIILDQLLLPHNLHRIDHYFDDDLRVFVVSRDPRDVFIINKYIWPAQNQQVIYPTEVKDFCSFYRSLRESEKPCASDKILRLRFEDLVYQYDETVQRIMAHLGVDPSSHTKKLQNFRPDRSIENTQLFENPAYQKEAAFIARELSDYLYPFPNRRTPDESKTF